MAAESRSGATLAGGKHFSGTFFIFDLSSFALLAGGALI
jgi:hypothetical protein